MRSLKNILEGLLDNDFEDQLDVKMLGELNNFINVLKSTKLDKRDTNVYHSDSQKLCDAAENVANTTSFKRITRVETNKMLNGRKPCTILVVHWEHGVYEWNLVNTTTAEYIRIHCMPSWKYWSGSSTDIQIHNIRPGREERAVGHNHDFRHYIFPEGTYEYFKKAITK